VVEKAAGKKHVVPNHGTLRRVTGNTTLREEGGRRWRWSRPWQSKGGLEAVFGDRQILLTDEEREHPKSGWDVDSGRVGGRATRLMFHPR